MIKNNIILFIILFLSYKAFTQVLQKPFTRVLFIGNSITDQNDLPEIYKRLCRANNVKSYTDKSIYPAISIYEQYFTKPSVKNGALQIKELSKGEFSSAQIKIIKSNWDVVLIQGREPIDFKNLSAILAFDSLCTKLKIKKLFLFEMYSLILFDSNERKKYLNEWENNVKPTLNKGHCKLLPIGRLFDLSNDLNPNLELFPDNCHPSFAGSVIIAASLFIELYGIIPGLTCFNKDLNEENLIAINKVLSYYYYRE